MKATLQLFVDKEKAVGVDLKNEIETECTEAERTKKSPKAHTKTDTSSQEKLFVEIQNSFLVLKMKLFFEQIARFCAFVVLRSEEITVELVIGNQKVFLSLLSTDINKGLS